MTGHFTAVDAEDDDCEDGNVDNESLVFSCILEPRHEALICSTAFPLRPLW